MMRNLLFSFLRLPAAKSPITLVHQALGFSAKAALALTIAVISATASAPTISAQTVTYAGSGAVNFGTANVCPSGKTAPAPCSKTLTLTYNITASGTLGTPKALSTGQPNLDYIVATGTTCTGSVTQGNTCKVNVTFAPIAPGQRKGAVEIVDAGNNILATTYIYGSGVGPLASFTQPTQRDIGNFGDASGIAVDASGNVFVADYLSGETDQVTEVLAVNGAIPENPVQKVLASNIYPSSLALDGAGNLWVIDTGRDLLELLPADGYSIPKYVSAILSNYADAVGIAVDGSGNLFFTNQGNSGLTQSSVLQLRAADNYSTYVTLGGGFSFTAPFGIAVDAGGNVFVADEQAPDGANFGVVDEILASGNYATVKTIHVSNGKNQGPVGVAIDAAGDLFVAYNQGNSFAEIVPIDGVIPSNPSIQRFGFIDAGGYPQGIAADNLGNLYVVNYSNVQELQLSTPPPLNFATTVVGSTSSDSPQSIQIQDRGMRTSM